MDLEQLKARLKSGGADPHEDPMLVSMLSDIESGTPMDEALTCGLLAQMAHSDGLLNIILTDRRVDNERTRSLGRLLVVQALMSIGLLIMVIRLAV